MGSVAAFARDIRIGLLAANLGASASLTGTGPSRVVGVVDAARENVSKFAFRLELRTRMVPMVG